MTDLIGNYVLSHKKERCGYSAFTLLEVMVAMAVLAIALTALLSSQSRTMFVAEANDFSIMSAHLGFLQMARILDADEPLSAASDTFAEPYKGYAWRVRIEDSVSVAEELLPISAQAGLQRIELSIIDNRRDESLAITRYRFGVKQP